jgi:nucleotide-binding universal stress UspA family protein
MKILFAYDGSESADAAIAAAGQLLAGRDTEAIVLSVWEPLIVEALHASKFGGRFSVPTSVPETDERSEHHARQLAEHGERIAREHGLNARPRWAADERDVKDAIIAEADELDVDLVVLGARGLTGMRALVGSVSNHVLQHVHRPLLVIPPAGAPAGRPLEHATAGEAS